jgi:hypothetical protein
MHRMTRRSGLVLTAAGGVVVALLVLSGIRIITLGIGSADAARSSSSSEIMRMMEQAKDVPVQAFDAI